MRRALAAARRGRAHAARAALAATALLGAVFLAVQGSEWARMVAWGVTAVSSPYGGMFYVLLGFHGLHVLAAVAALLALAAAREPARTRARLQAAGLYWYFVCGVWAVIFPALYVR